MATYVKLSDTQAFIIREAFRSTSPQGAIMRSSWKRGANVRTWKKLFELGLIASSDSYAPLTDAGVSAHAVLNNDADTRKVRTGPQTRTAHIVDRQPKVEATHTLTLSIGGGTLDVFVVRELPSGRVVATWTIIDNPDGYSVDSVMEARGWKGVSQMTLGPDGSWRMDLVKIVEDESDDVHNEDGIKGRLRGLLKF